MDKFPEAFRRFEQVVETRRIRNFRQLKLAFEYWAGSNWKNTPRQNHALRIEARRLGIPVPKYEMSYRTWRHDTFTVRGRRRSVFRDLKTGRFIKKPF